VEEALSELEEETEEEPEVIETERRSPAPKPAVTVTRTIPALPHRVTVRTRDKRRSPGEQNTMIMENLEKVYPDLSRHILEEAQNAYHYRNPLSETSAEPYELLEGGYIDSTLEELHLRPFTIGRPKNLG
jgi:hypothetical protein